MSTVNIGIFGRRNVGKSSIINVLTGQDVAIVSDMPGTTTDPVRKRLEIFGLGPCVLVDTAGIDDEGELGRMRVARTESVVEQIDLALLVFTGDNFGEYEERILRLFARYALPVVLVHSKSDIGMLDRGLGKRIKEAHGMDAMEFSTVTTAAELGEEVRMLTDKIKEGVSSSRYSERSMFDGLVSSGQHVLLVCPIDSEAPTGRLILPQVNAIRNLLDVGAVATVVQPDRLAGLFSDGREFSLVVTDSQAFSEVAAVVPENVPLTSFSMLLARSKGCFEDYCKGTPKISALKDGDRVLILESCTHHASCDDIGRVKIPALMRRFTGKRLEFDVVGGLDAVSRPIEDYAFVLQCGGCVITRRQLFSRLLPAIERGIPVSNYGMAISYMKGIYERALKPLTV